MDFSAFDQTKMEEHAKRARGEWQQTEAYREFEEKSRGRSDEAENALAQGLMSFFEEFGKIKESNPASDAAQKLVARLQAYITEHYYTCTPQILKGLGAMYAAGGEFTENIDKTGGRSTAVFAAKAIEIYCK